jgi:hypothetical protein
MKKYIYRFLNNRMILLFRVLGVYPCVVCLEFRDDPESRFSDRTQPVNECLLSCPLRWVTIIPVGKYAYPECVHVAALRFFPENIRNLVIRTYNRRNGLYLHPLFGKNT